ncbi:hypothetical protein [Gloeobacter morelensis]|uniref:Tetratricopeptide repeat protein n=1 Tax=Gloeobacter morelensis MG652769 TaxID=2781736 RepID=A0ABY3PJK9_9CYAN|nr:hypothetical protein [Gloeobacter morelensis]UFP93871.1 tetratricopeptide repeat protein [Gloeobacter morelensis MG652769]
MRERAYLIGLVVAGLAVLAGLHLWRVRQENHWAVAQAMLEEGTRRLRAGDLRGAETAFTRALEADGDNDYLYLQRGLTRLGLSEYTAAVTDLSRSIALQPRPIAYLHRCEAHKSAFHYREALRDCSEAIRRDPGDSAAYRLRAAVRRALGDAPGAQLDEQHSAELLRRRQLKY